MVGLGALLAGIATVLGLFFVPLNLMLHVRHTVFVRRRVTDLLERMGALNGKYTDVKNVVKDAERGQTHDCKSEVRNRLRRVEEIEAQVREIKRKFEPHEGGGGICFGRYSGNIWSSYKIGSEAYRLLKKVEELIEEFEKFGGDYVRPRSPRRGHVTEERPNLQLEEMESNVGKILGYLADPKVRVVGIYGMGGVGKTTLLEAINNELVKNIDKTFVLSINPRVSFGPFDYVIMEEVSKDGDQLKDVQEKVARRLSLQPDISLLSRRNAISNFLKEKRFVLLLDNLWNSLDLGEIGIIPNKNSTVIFTTRSENICSRMGAKKKVKVECLKEQNALQLFKDNATVGNDSILSNHEIRRCQLAEKISNQCKGLPLALTVIGRAMSTRTSPEEWEEALDFLENSQLTTTFPDIEEDLLGKLQLSYNFLPNEETRECFKHCALFHDVCNIDKDMLIQCYLSHSNDNYTEVEVHALIKNLKSACLLEDKEEYVQMHDIIRHMALWIACDYGKSNAKWLVRKKPLSSIPEWESAQRVSVKTEAMTKLPKPKRECSVLSTFILRGNANLKDIPPMFFVRLSALIYLDLSGTQIFKLPRELSKLETLQYLNLADTYIMCLSIHLKSLKNLRYLILRDCKFLNYIPRGLISKLKSLRVLDIFGCPFIFRKADMQATINESWNSGKTNIDELRELKENVKALGLTLHIETISDLKNFVDDPLIRQLKIVGLKESNVRDNTDTEKQIELLDLEKYNELKWLSFSELNRFTTITWERGSLLQMFPRLTTVNIESCHGLEDLTWIGHLPRLKYLWVHRCNGLKKIINDEIVEMNDESEEITRHESNDGVHLSPIFPRIRKIHLKDLPKLDYICNKTIISSLVPVLRVLECPMLRSLPPTVYIGPSNELDDS